MGKKIQKSDNFSNESKKENGMENRWKGGDFTDIRSIVARQLSTGQRPVSKIKARTIIDG